MGPFLSSEQRRAANLAAKVEKIRAEMEKLTDAELQAKTTEFKERLCGKDTLTSLLPEAYAVAGEAARRVLGMLPFRVQILGAIALHQGKVAEMKTGEGKTLVATMPTYLHALEGKGVHVVTVNDYLARRDAEEMGRLYTFLGLTVGCVTSDMERFLHKFEYQRDITYVTGNELGFDYLRDNMVTRQRERVLRGLNYAIIDEADSILIDEARTPLIIAGHGDAPTNLLRMCDLVAKHLKQGNPARELTKADMLIGNVGKENGDFIINAQDKLIFLTEQGIKKVEMFFRISNYADPENIEIQHNIELALRANYLMHKDVDYIVKNDEIVIVDEFTGRVMPGRRYTDGLHQALEAKENVTIKEENKTLATITFQNFFNKYALKSGMTGTAKTEENEFRTIYGMDVDVIQTNRPMIRVDLDDSIYKTQRGKYRAVIRELVAAHEKGQPVLLGTASVEESERYSRLISRHNIPHRVLNAKQDAEEAEIVAQAGRHGAVTIATNMAGRGTDIKLDDEARAAGGLYVIGTQRYESRRIDNQLIGRSGRQGDPGKSKFFLSLEDDLLKLFVPESMIKSFNSLGLEEDQEIINPLLSKAVRNAQKRVENNNFMIRKNLIDYDEVVNVQRETIYKERNRILDGENVNDTVLAMIDLLVDDVVNDCSERNHVDAARLSSRLKALGFTGLDSVIMSTSEKAAEALKNRIKALYVDVAREFESEQDFHSVERMAMLRAIDTQWRGHLDNMAALRQSIGTQRYAQRDPIIEYRIEGYKTFQEMYGRIARDTVRTMFLCAPVAA